MDEQAAKSIDYTQKLWDALNRIDSVAVTLPTFEVIHEGDMDAVVENIVIAISKAAAALSQPAAADEVKAELVIAAKRALNVLKGMGHTPDPRNALGALEAAIKKATP